MEDEVYFWHGDKHGSLLQVDTIIFKHAKSIQNNKFAISLQYLKKVVSDEVELLHVDKHRGFPK